MTDQNMDNQICEESALLISRNLDGDLERDEILTLYKHLAVCPRCQEHMNQISTLGYALGELKASYQQHSPSPRLKLAVRKAIYAKRSNTKNSNKKKSFFQKIQNHWLESGARKTALIYVSAAAVFGLLLVVLGQPYFQNRDLPDRFFVNEIPLHSAEDSVNWNQHYIILPAQVVHMQVLEPENTPFYFKVMSPKAVEFSVSHNETLHDREQGRKYPLNGVQYITLKNPRYQDVIHIRNHGSHPISLKMFTLSPKAIQANFN